MRRSAAAELESALRRSVSAWAGQSLETPTKALPAEKPIWILVPDSLQPGGYSFRVQDGPGAPERNPTPVELAEYQMAVGF